MNCEDTIERLPWLLNGSLEAEERSRLLAHLRGCGRCREALGETRAAFDVFSRHLSPEQLVALAAGEAPEGSDPDLLERHLEFCAPCAADLELARMSRRLVEEEKVAVMPAARGKTLDRSTRSTRSARSTWLPAAMAAGLTAVVLGGGWYSTSREAGRLSGQLAETRALTLGVESNPVVVTLSAPSAERGEGDGAPQTLPAGVPLVFSMTPGNPEDRPEALAVRIFDAGEKLVLSPADLKLQHGRLYTLALPSRALPPGAYTVRTYRIQEEKREPFEEYPIRIGS